MRTRRAFMTAAATAASAAIVTTALEARARAAGDPASLARRFMPVAGRGPAVAMLMYPDMTLLDFVSPLHFLSGIPGARVHLVTNQATLAPVASDSRVAMVPTVTMAECPTDVDVLFVPGGTTGTVAAARDAATLDFVRRTGRAARWITSVCTGSIVLGAAGLLHGRRATSHWSVVPELDRFGAVPVHERVVRDGPVITAAGVSAGLDLGVFLADAIAGTPVAEAMVLVSEYAPRPLLHGGTPEAARPEVRRFIESSLEGFVQQVRDLPVAKVRA